MLDADKARRARCRVADGKAAEAQAVAEQNPKAAPAPASGEKSTDDAAEPADKPEEKSAGDVPPPVLHELPDLPPRKRDHKPLALAGSAAALLALALMGIPFGGPASEPDADPSAEDVVAASTELDRPSGPQVEKRSPEELELTAQLVDRFRELARVGQDRLNRKLLGQSLLEIERLRERIESSGEGARQPERLRAMTELSFRAYADLATTWRLMHELPTNQYHFEQEVVYGDLMDDARMAAIQGTFLLQFHSDQNFERVGAEQIGDYDRFIESRRAEFARKVRKVLRFESSQATVLMMVQQQMANAGRASERLFEVFQSTIS